MMETNSSAGGSSAPPPPRPCPPPPPPTVIIQERRRGCGFWLGWLLAVLFFCAAVFFLLGAMALSVSQLSTGPTTTVFGVTLTEKTIEGSGKDKVLLLPMRGIIGEEGSTSVWGATEGTVPYVRLRLQAARRDADVKAVLLQVDSPGGGITASDIISEEIRRFKEATGKKVVASLGDVAASGGYYVSAGSDWIVAHPTTLTGSIGVIMMSLDLTLLLEKIGVQDNPIKSGPYKDIGSWTRPMSPEERQMLQGMIDHMLGRFVEVIVEGRRLPAAKVKALADGRIFTAAEAKASGLVDQLGYYEDAVQKVKELAKLSQFKVVRFDKSFSFASLLDTEVEGRLSRPRWDLLLSDLAFPRGPRLMYLWTGR